MASKLVISCLCGKTSQEVQPREAQNGLSICHCDACRYSSGVLCASYYPIHEPVNLSAAREYKATDGSTRYFCEKCGCQILRWTADHGWEAATGVIKGPSDKATAAQTPAKYQRHEGVAETGDGGLSEWIVTVDGIKLDIDSSPSQPSNLDDSETLPASCDCGTVRFHLTRPDEASSDMSYNYPDLMVPYHLKEGPLVGNPSNETWWLRDKKTKYLAGTCSCRSCRLITGFEIQTWTFVPRTNIFFHIKRDGSEAVVPLDFTTLPSGIIQSYESSDGVLREFCVNCGATVFWHNGGRAGIIDVSAGLLRASEGARAENWLEWWTERVSFTEDTELDRWGEEARRARALISGLEAGFGQ